MEQFGAPRALIDELTKSRIVEILPINWAIVVWFCDVSDLMRWRSDGQCLGLDLLQVKAEAELSIREYNSVQFNGLRVMSKTAASVINKG
ncbi:MAG: hypothetical protein HRU23_19005 [Gammaproteobacteria bacterium]|nr:hypothetical protein [Gammaproteobacteria bacterium]